MVRKRDRYNEYMSEYMLKRYHDRRRESFEILGNRCAACGSEEDINIDHIDPFNKDFSLSKLWSVSRERYLEELSKCQLLCEKCHKAKTKVDGSTYKGKLRGTKSPHARLTEEQVVEIRSSTESNSALAAALGVTRGCVSHARKGRTWKHLPL